MAAVLAFLIPQLFYKFQLFTYGRALSKDSRVMFNSLLLGFTIASVIGLLLICKRNVYIISALTKVSTSVIWWFILPVPVPLAIFCIFDIWSTYKNVFPKQLKSKSCCQKCSAVCLFVSVVMVTLFLQLVSFHSGWFILLLITFPLQVGTLFCILLTLYIASVFNFGFFIQFCRKRNKGKTFFDGMKIINYFFIGIAYFLLSYYITMAGYPHEDAITKLIPSILPLVFIGFCTWMVKKMSSETFNHDEENQLDHNDQTQRSP